MKNVRFILVLIFAFASCTHLAAAPKQSPLKFGVGKKSEFVMPNGDRAYVTGVSGLKASDFSKRKVDKMLTFKDSRIVDAEKSPETHVDDYWCEQLADCNLLVWTGWAKYAMGVTNEDDFALMLLKNPEICKKDIFDWTLAKRGYVLDDSTDKVIAWVHGKEKSVDVLVWRVAKYIGDADRLAYMQVDWQNRDGSHAVTCCGYTVKKGMDKDPLKPESLSGVFIINSDNDKRKGSGGRKAPNTMQFQRAWFDKKKKAYFSEFPHGDIGKIRFFCFLRAYDKNLIKFLKPVKRDN